MKKLNLLGVISLSLILSGLSCKKDEGPEPATVCGMKGDLRKNLRAQVSWSEPYNDWVLEVDNDNNGEIDAGRSEEHTSELQSLMRISYAVFCLKKKKNKKTKDK